jgi:hypothetical protein
VRPLSSRLSDEGRKEQQREARERASHGGVEVMLGTVDCRLSPPAPATNRLVCNVSVKERRLFVPHAKVIANIDGGR